MIFLAILYIALAVMFIAFSLIVKIGLRQLKRMADNLPIKIEIKRVKKSHI